MSWKTISIRKTIRGCLSMIQQKSTRQVLQIPQVWKWFLTNCCHCKVSVTRTKPHMIYA